VFLPMQMGDVTETCADVSRLKLVTGYAPHIPISEGLPKFVEWYRSFYG
jgi:UDP-glucuronate 4-epimerase